MIVRLLYTTESQEPHVVPTQFVKEWRLGDPGVNRGRILPGPVCPRNTSYSPIGLETTDVVENLILKVSFSAPSRIISIFLTMLNEWQHPSWSARRIAVTNLKTLPKLRPLTVSDKRHNVTIV